MYYFYPPFFNVPEESNFPDGWEVFCCKLLNLGNGTSEIFRRLPPEDGVDLFYPAKYIAYQCKSIDSGLTSGYNLTAIRASYNAALRIKDTLGWTKYVLCINIDLTGNQLANLKEEFPEIEVLTRSHWLTLCQKFPVAVQENFRRLIPVPPQRIEDRINEGFYSNYSDKLKNLLKDNPFNLLFYSNRHNAVYSLSVSKEFKVSDIIHILRGVFNLPQPMEFDGGISVQLSYSIFHDNNNLTLSQTLEEAGLTENSLITFWLKMVYSEGPTKAESITMQLMKVRVFEREFNPVEAALSDYKQIIERRFIEFDNRCLSTDEA